MRNREYSDLRELRRDVVALLRAGRQDLSYHAENTHREIPRKTKINAVLKSGRDRPNHHSRPDQASYVCWWRHPRLGLLRAVYAVLEDEQGPYVLIITVFREEGRGETPR